ncbi:hypothetical protein N2152v2_004478 [Parachlorella kessleri]
MSFYPRPPPGCGNSNYGFREQCNKCGARRPGGLGPAGAPGGFPGGPRPPGMPGGPGMMGGHPMGMMGPPMGGPMPRPPPPGGYGGPSPMRPPPPGSFPPMGGPGPGFGAAGPGMHGGPAGAFGSPQMMPGGPMPYGGGMGGMMPPPPRPPPHAPPPMGMPHMMGAGPMAGPPQPRPLPANIKPGEWACPLCGTANAQFMERCEQCRTQKPLDLPLFGTARPSSQQPHSQHNVPAKVGDWICGDPACRNTNFQWRQSCNKCGQPRPANPELVGGELAAAAVAQQPPAHAKPGDWICPSCSNSNFSWRTECNKCGKARPEGAPVVQQQPGALPAQLPNVPLKPGDWSCSSCGNLNFMRRTECNKCGQPKTEDATVVGPQLGVVAGMPSHAQPGDWICPSCSNTNFSWRGECNKCGVARPEDAATVPPPAHLSSMPGVQLDSHARPGDWVCPACSNTNFSWRDKCHKCEAERAPDAQVVTGQGAAAAAAGGGMPRPTNITPRPGDWICMYCRNTNFAFRAECNQCGKARGDAPVVAEDGTIPELEGTAADGAATSAEALQQQYNMYGYDQGQYDQQAYEQAYAQQQGYDPQQQQQQAYAQQGYAQQGYDPSTGAGYDASGYSQQQYGQQYTAEQYAAYNEQQQQYGTQAGQQQQYGAYGAAQQQPVIGPMPQPMPVQQQQQQPTMVPARIQPTLQAKAGDWVCSSCANHNFGWRPACHKCGMAKPDDAATVGSDGSVPSVMAAPSAAGMGAGSGGVGGGQGGARREGRRRGGALGAQRDAAAAAAGYKQRSDSGDWSCSKCGNHNYAWRPACNKCGTAKDGAAGANGRARSRSRSPVRAVNPACTFASSAAQGPEEQLGGVHGDAQEERGLEERFSEDEFQPDKWAPPEAQVGGACGPLPTTILRAGEVKEGRELDIEARGLEERFSEDEYSR